MSKDTIQEVKESQAQNTSVIHITDWHTKCSKNKNFRFKSQQKNEQYAKDENIN